MSVAEFGNGRAVNKQIEGSGQYVVPYIKNDVACQSAPHCNLARSTILVTYVVYLSTCVAARACD